MSRKLNYSKTQGYWVYAHTMPDGMQYIGISQQQPCQRWVSSSYKETALDQYIERFGWENITHTVLLDGLTKNQAEQWEDKLIVALSMNCLCINERRSGGIKRNNRKEYEKTYNKSNREQRLEDWKAYAKQRRSTPEGKIYDRVKNYNRCHPDLAIETPMEAKQKYLDWGYIPSYIKSCDLI